MKNKVKRINEGTVRKLFRYRDPLNALQRVNPVLPKAARLLAAGLAVMMISSFTACVSGGNGSGTESSSITEVSAETTFSGKTTPCTDEEINALIGSGDLIFSSSMCRWLIENQDKMPADVITCLNEHIGEYRVYKLSGAEGELMNEELVTGEELDIIAAVLQLHGYTPDMFTDNTAVTLGDNAKYMVDTSEYPTPEDGDRFLPFFQNGDAEVLAETMGVTISAPREVTYSTFSDGAESLCVCAKITNTSNKKIQLLPANMTEADWEKVEGYDKSLVINWGENGTDIIPLAAATILEPGESTVQRYTYTGKENEDYDFISRYSYRVTDGTSTELLAAVILCHYTPSKAKFGSCTVNGTVVNSETGAPVPFVNVQSSRNENDYAITDENGKFSIVVPAFRSDATGNWARTTIFVNEIGVGGNKPDVDPNYAEESIVVVPKDNETMDLSLELKPKPKQVNYTITSEHDLGMQAYAFDTSADIVVTAPFHTSFSEQYVYENGYIHVFDKTGKLLFEKPIYGQDRCCDISNDGSLVSAIVHSSTLNSGEPDKVVIWDINGNEVFSHKVKYKANENLIVKPIAPAGSYETALYDAEISNDNSMVAISAGDGYVCIVKISDGSVVRDFYMDSENSHQLFFSNDDKVIYTASDCGDFKATEIATGKVLWEKYIEAYVMNYVLTDVFVITSTKATGTGYLICTELKTGKTLWTLDVGMRCGDMCLSHDEKTMFWGTDTGTTNERAVIIDAETGTPLWSLISGKQAAAFSTDDEYIMMRSGGNLTLRTITGEHLYGANIAPDYNSKGDGLMNWVSEENTVDNILVVNLDNPTIDSTIPIIVGGGVTLKITGSVTFNGGLYRFDYIEGTEGRATVDISELTINGTDELGKTKSPDIMFWREKDGIDVIFDQTNPHLAYTPNGGSGNNELRYAK